MSDKEFIKGLARLTKGGNIVEVRQINGKIVATAVKRKITNRKLILMTPITG